MSSNYIEKTNKNRKIFLLDCTLRDGGIVIDFNFGEETMQEIKSKLESSGVEYIECGYIDENKGFKKGKTCFDSIQSINENFLHFNKKKDIQYVAMIDYGTFDVNELPIRDANGLDGIRFAFHKEMWKESIEACKIIESKGYDIYIQPMVCTRYSDEEYIELIEKCNTDIKNMKSFYIVDSFGQMNNKMIIEKMKIIDQHLAENAIIGFHAHNNMQLAYSNTITFMSYCSKHDIIIDASIMGMGKGAGNLCSELIMKTLIEIGKQYEVSSLFNLIYKYFSKIRKQYFWGYCLDYYLSSIYSCTPSYVKIFMQDERVNTDVLIQLLKYMPNEKKAACDKIFAKTYLKQYFEKKD